MGPCHLARMAEVQSSLRCALRREGIWADRILGIGPGNSLGGTRAHREGYSQTERVDNLGRGPSSPVQKERVVDPGGERARSGSAYSYTNVVSAFSRPSKTAPRRPIKVVNTLHHVVEGVTPPSPV